MWRPAGWLVPGCATSAPRPSFTHYGDYKPTYRFASWAWIATTGPSSSIGSCSTIAPITGITFTRSRPYLKNDTCHVEQKNWAVVRRLVGYDRLELPALAALERIHDLAGDYVNFLHPVRKLVSKTRSGPRVTRRYDVAQTPFQRLLDSGVLSVQMTRELKARSANVDPVRLKVQLEAAQRTLAARAVRSESYVRHA